MRIIALLSVVFAFNVAADPADGHEADHELSAPHFQEPQLHQKQDELREQYSGSIRHDEHVVEPVATHSEESAVEDLSPEVGHSH